jgi:hypothetical protein
VTARFCELAWHNPRTPLYPKYRKPLETRLLYRFHIVGISLFLPLDCTELKDNSARVLLLDGGSTNETDGGRARASLYKQQGACHSDELCCYREK